MVRNPPFKTFRDLLIFSLISPWSFKVKFQSWLTQLLTAVLFASLAFLSVSLPWCFLIFRRQTDCKSIFLCHSSLPLLTLTPARSQLSSLPLQILLYFNGWYSLSWVILNFCLLCYKSYVYHYPETALEWEFVMLFMLAFIENARITLSSRVSLMFSFPFGPGNVWKSVSIIF